MDVGNPSNFIRILELFHQQLGDLKKIFSSYSISDDDTVATIKETYLRHQYLLDPHGAVGYVALEKYLLEHPVEKGMFLETAHPVKFYDVVEPIVNQKIPIPATVVSILNSTKQAVQMGTAYGEFKEYLLNEILT